MTPTRAQIASLLNSVRRGYKGRGAYLTPRKSQFLATLLQKMIADMDRAKTESEAT